MKKYYSHIIFCLALIISLLCPTVQAADGTSFDPTKVEVKAKGVSSIPVGTIISWPVAQNPADFQNTDGTYNWLECNGQSFDATVYPELSALVGPVVPDLRGLFLRGYGSQAHAQVNGSTIGVTSTLHQSGALGQVQGDAARKILGSFRAAYWNSTSALVDDHPSGGTWSSGPFTQPITIFDSSRVTPTATENRPVNTAVRFLMRARP